MRQQFRCCRAGRAAGGVSLFFIYSLIVAIILVLFVRIFAAEKTSLWNLIVKRYKTTKGDTWKDDLKKDTQQMEYEFGTGVAKDFKRAEDIPQ